MNSKEITVLSIFTLITVLVWIVYDVYHAATTTTITTVQQELMRPLTPTFDHETIVKIVDDEL
ncbi:hypothetical protein HYT02_01045 [Candidatus Gottesmanbacteria bacterium]|nr:hypothetical protein [Candidatus Gottesmanbacteria bacterium]